MSVRIDVPGLRQVVVVEDEPEVMDVLKEVLSDIEVQLTTATDAEQALQLLASGVTPDLLITNVRMPGPVDGLELARRFRDAHPAMRVIVVSGHQAFVDETDSLGKAHFLMKPFRVRALHAAIANLFSES